MFQDCTFSNQFFIQIMKQDISDIISFFIITDRNMLKRLPIITAVLDEVFLVCFVAIICFISNEEGFSSCSWPYQTLHKNLLGQSIWCIVNFCTVGLEVDQTLLLWQ